MRRRVGVPIAVDLREAPVGDLAASADVAVLNVGALGGVRRALRAAESCAVPCTVAADAASSIGTSGGLALAGVLDDLGYAGMLGGVRLLAGDLVSSGRSLIARDGSLPVAPMPPAPETALLQRFAAGPERVAWWRERLRAAQSHL